MAMFFESCESNQKNQDSGFDEVKIFMPLLDQFIATRQSLFPCAITD